MLDGDLHLIGFDEQSHDGVLKRKCESTDANAAEMLTQTEF
jgi:hypothetical protein